MEQYLEIRRTYVKLEGKIPCMHYEPLHLTKRSKIAVILEHSDDDYFEFYPAKALAERGYRCFVSHVTNLMQPLDDKLRELSKVVSYAKDYPGVEKLVLLGHSGGATLMSAYQSVAENGCGIFQGIEKLIPIEKLPAFPAADGVMFLDANFGNGAMSLLSLDPSVVDERNGMKRDPELDLFNPANGFDPAGCTFSDAFIKRYWEAQAARMKRLIIYAQERVAAIQVGKGRFADDEPMLIPGGTQFAPCNKLINQMPERFFAYTKGEWDLVHQDGSVTRQVVPCVRPMKAGMLTTEKYHFGALMTTVKTFLKSSAVLPTDAFGYDETTLYGVKWDSSYCCTTGNAAHIAAPMLIMGMTGSYEYITAEHIFLNASKCTDKTVAFVEGAGHNFVAVDAVSAEPDKYGDTVKSCFDFVAKWIDREFL